MRWLPFALLCAACGTTSDADEDCPPAYSGAFGDEVEGTSCSTTRTCFVENQFSTCASAFYRCVGGVWQVDRGLGATEGGACGDSPLAACNYEGNAGCDSAPTAETCICASDGTWHCTCACADPSRSTCI